MRMASVTWLILAASWLICSWYVWLISSTESAGRSTRRLWTVMRLRRAILLRIVRGLRARWGRRNILVLISTTPSGIVRRRARRE